MPRYGRITLTAAATGAMLLVPSGAPSIAVAEIPSVSSFTSTKTIATIDAMLSPPIPEAELRRRLEGPMAAPEAESELANLKPAVLIIPDSIETTALDPSFKPDAVGRSAVNLRAGPSSSTRVIAVLSAGQAVNTGARVGGWVQVTLSDRATGWVYSRYLASSSAIAP